MDPQYIIGRSSFAMHSPNWGSGRDVTPAQALEEDAPEGVEDVADADVSYSSDVYGDVRTASESRRNLGPEAVTSEFTFDDFLDLINPLQHIPVVDMIYREVTGDKMSGTVEMIGNVALGGPLGILTGAINAILQQETGKNFGETMIAMVFGDDEKDGVPAEDTGTGDSTVMLAEAGPAVPAVAAQNNAVPQAPDEKQAEDYKVALADNPRWNTPEKDPEKAAEKIAEKAPFGGVMAPVGQPPAGQTAVADAGQRMYSLRKVKRLAASSQPHMPVSSEPDVRLKPVDRQRIGRLPTMVAEAPQAPPQNHGIPLVSKQQAQQILGLDKTPAQSVAAAPHGNSNNNPIPPQLIQDLMLLNLEKYKNSGGNLDAFTRGGSVDIEG